MSTTRSEQDSIEGLGRLARGGGLGIASIVASSVLRLVVTAQIARILSPDEYGRYVIAVTVAMMAGGLGAMGMSQAVLRWLALVDPRGSTGRTYIQAVLLRATQITFVSVSVVGVAVYLLRGVIAGFLGSADINHIVLAAAVLPAWVALQVLSGAARALGHVLNYFIIREIGPIGVQVIAVAVVGLWWPTPEAMLGVFIGAHFLTLPYAFGHIRSIVRSVPSGGPSPKQVLAGEMWSFGSVCALTGVAWVLKDRVAVLLTAAFLTPEEAGVLFNASRLGFLMTVILSGLNVILAPYVAREHHYENHEGLRTAYQTAIRWAVVAAFPVLTFVVLEPRAVMFGVFGDTSAVGPVLLVVIMLSRFASLLVGSPGVLLQMTGHQNYEGLLVVVVVIVSAACLWFALPAWGVVGGSVVLGALVFGGDGARALVAFRLTGVAPIKLQVVGLVASGLIAAIAVARLSPLNGSPLASGVQSLVIVALTTLVLLRASTDATERAAVRMLLTKVWARLSNGSYRG